MIITVIMLSLFRATIFNPMVSLLLHEFKIDNFRCQYTMVHAVNTTMIFTITLALKATFPVYFQNIFTK